MRIPFGAKVNFALTAGLVLLVLVGFFSYRSIDQLVETGRSEGRSFEDMGQVDRIVASLRTAESAQRNYLITGQRADLAEYGAIRSLIYVEIARLRGKTLDPRQKLRLNEIEVLMRERFELIAQAIELREVEGLEATVKILESRRNRELALRMLRRVEEFKEQEWRTLRHRQADTAYSAETSSFMIIWGGLFSAAMLLWAMVIINRYHAGREAAEAALRASEAQMRLVTDAMPALIAYLDYGERFRFHNKAFEKWFGLGPQDFEGRTLHQVIGDPTYESLRPRLRAVLAGEEARFDFSYAARDGRNLDLAAELVPRLDAARGVIGFYALVTDVTELKRLERMKAEFVATVSHELRTPLTSISGSLGLLAGGVVGALPEAVKTLIEIARDSCERLVRLINDILDVEKIESGKMSFSFQVLELGALLERSVKANEGYAASHGVSVRISPLPPGIRVRADPDRLTQVTTNLLSNACKFSPAGSVVEIEVARRDGSVRVSVSDRGPGIPEAFRARIFERFSRADSSDARRIGGTGLGLAISRGIVEHMEGKIGFALREGGGTIFYFDLPERGE